MDNKKIEKFIYPVEGGSSYGEVLYGYDDIEEAKKDYKEETGEDLDVDNCQFLNVELIEGDENEDIKFSWQDQTKGIPSIVNIY